jgi:hypothetical protein
MASSCGRRPPVVYDSDDEVVTTQTADERAAVVRVARQRWASGASLIKDALPTPAQLGSAATEEIKELSPHVDTAADLREFPCLGSGTAVWLGSDMTAACRSIELKLSVLVQVRMEPVHWPGADGLRCDRHFHARRVPPEPVVVKVGSPFTCWSMAVSMQSKAVSLAPQPPLLLSMASGRKQRRRSALRARVEPAAERQRQARALVDAAEQKRVNRAKKAQRRVASKALLFAVEAPVQRTSQSCPSGRRRAKARRRTSHAYHRTPHGVRSEPRDVCSAPTRPTRNWSNALRSNLRDVLDEMQRGRRRASASASRLLARTAGAAVQAAGSVLSPLFFIFSNLITPAAPLPLLAEIQEGTCTHSTALSYPPPLPPAHTGCVCVCAC